MFLKRVRSGQSSVGAHSLIHESESIRLQRDIERITQKLEYEKRESNYLDERIEMMNHEISLITQKEKPSKSSSKSLNLQNSLHILEKKLEFEIIQLNEAKANNKQIRSTIDEYRLERISYKRTLNCLKQDLNNYSQQAEAKNLEYRQGEELDHQQKSKINILRCKSANEQSKYGDRISQLTGVLQEEKQQRSKIFKNMEKEVFSNMNRPIEGIEISKILKRVLEKWSFNTREKKKQLDNYTKHIKIVEDAFKQIQQATGISSIEEIVTAFIKSQEQNYEIYTYMNNITSEIDTLEENLKATKNKIAIMEQFKESGEKKGIEIKAKLEKDYEKVEKKIKEKKLKLVYLRREISSIAETIYKLLSIFEKMSLKPETSQQFDSGWLENFNEENIMNVLGYIEEYINFILVLYAYSTSSENPILSYLPVGAMNSKSIENKPSELKDFLDAKDLYDDKELDESKNPLPVNELISKAVFIYEKKKHSESFNENPSLPNSFLQSRN